MRFLRIYNTKKIIILEHHFINTKKNSNLMKSALVYLKKYIDENYHRGQDPCLQKSPNSLQLNKNHTIDMFIPKMKYQLEKPNRKEFYFKSPKTLKPSFLKKKFSQTQEGLKLQQNQNQHRQNKIKNQQYNNQTQQQQKNNPTSLFQTKDIQDRNFSQFQFSPKKQKTVQQNNKGPLKAQTPKKKHNNWNENKIFNTGKITQKSFCKSIKRIGYDNLDQYLKEMKKFQEISKKQTTHAQYYPMAEIFTVAKQIKNYEQRVKIQKDSSRQKYQYFSNRIKIQKNFELRSLTVKTSSLLLGHKKQQHIRSQRSSQKQIDLETNQEAKSQLLVQFDEILVCNCGNKNFFQYSFQNQIDCSSFLLITTPLLGSTANKQNQSVRKNIDSHSCQLYFCCLVDRKNGQHTCFFWIAKPIQYYCKNTVLEAVRKFIFQIQLLEYLQIEKVQIVDYKGRLSYIQKAQLTKFQQTIAIQNVQKYEKIKQDKKRQSLSISRKVSNLESSQTFLSLVNNTLDQESTFANKKVKNEIAKKGMFKMFSVSNGKIK